MTVQHGHFHPRSFLSKSTSKPMPSGQAQPGHNQMERFKVFFFYIHALSIAAY
jgi:hypothetical protein